jgi:exodeoxyribonuclease VII large subunit
MAWQRRVEAARQRLRALESRRVWTHPQEQWASRLQAVDELSERQQAALEGILSRHRERLTGLEQTLQALNPLQVLERGYSVFRRYPQGSVIRRLADVQVGERGEVMLRDGRVVCRVEQVTPAG